MQVTGGFSWLHSLKCDSNKHCIILPLDCDYVLEWLHFWQDLEIVSVEVWVLGWGVLHVQEQESFIDETKQLADDIQDLLYAAEEFLPV